MVVKWSRHKRSSVILYWINFGLTRPFGATFGDLLTKTPVKGGLGFGTQGSSLILFVILVGLIVYTSTRNPRCVADNA